MTDIALGVVALALGAVLCFRGRLALRAIMAIWGGLVGFGFGASTAAALSGEGVLAGPIGWISAILAAVVFAWLAYAFYVLGVVIAVGSIGYGLGSAAGTAAGLSGGALLLAATAGAALLVVAALAANIPGLVLTVLSAIAGSAALVGGLMVLTGAMDGRAVTAQALPTVIGAGQGWSLLFLLLAGAGVVVQSRGRAWRSGRTPWSSGPSVRVGPQTH